MMVQIKLINHKAIDWQIKDNNYFRGWFFNEDIYYEKDSTFIFYDLIKQYSFKRAISMINGNYSCIYSNEKSTYVAVDRIRSFPLFYCNFEGQVYVSDSVEELVNIVGKNIDDNHMKEFMATGYITGDKTMFKNIYQLEAGEYLKIDNETGKIEKCNYYVHTHVPNYSKDSEELCKELDEVLLNVFNRLIKSLNGKPVVLFLSGGYDSRLVAVMLKRLNYDNVYCISFGKDDNREVIAAKDVARALGLKWELLNMPRDFFRNMLEDKEFQRFIKDAGYGTNTPYYQGVLAKEFMEKGIIPKDSVILTGNSGDLLEGDQFDTNFIEGNEYTKDNIIDAILDSHYMLFGKRLNKNLNLRKYISRSIDSVLDKDLYSFEECHDILEYFNWRERQSKYVVNDVRCYDDFLGNEWRLPLWDSEFMDFWLRVPVDLRKNRKLYYEYIKEEKFLTANNPTLYDRAMNYFKKRTMLIVELAYPFRKLIHFLNGDTPFYAGSMLDFIKILIITKGNRTNTITTHIYKELEMFYGYDFNSIKKLTR